MAYIQTNENGSFSTVISTGINIEWDNNHLCPVERLTLEEATLFRISNATEIPAPAYDAATQLCEHSGYEMVNGEWVTKWVVSALSRAQIKANAAELLANAKEAKRTEVRTAYELDAGADVTVGTIVYQGGFDSAIKLDAAKRLAEAAGLLDVTFFDSTNNPQVLLLADAQLVILSVAAAFQTALARKQAAMVKIDKSTTSTIAKVNAISY